jgi:hypothetical protein
MGMEATTKGVDAMTKERKKRFMRSGGWFIGLSAWVVLMGGAAEARGEPRPYVIARRVQPVWIPPVYQIQSRVIVDPPVYEERERRIWHEPLYETRRVLVEVPAEVVRERVAERDRHGRICGYRVVERVVRPARHTWREERVLVRPGHYETVIERVLVRPETRRVVQEEVLVKPGYWTTPGAVVIGKDYPSRDRYHGRPYGSRGGYYYREPSREVRVRVKR